MLPFGINIMIIPNGSVGFAARLPGSWRPRASQGEPERRRLMTEKDRIIVRLPDRFGQTYATEVGIRSWSC